MKIKCPKCKRTSTYITTEQYNPNVKPDGSMVRLANSKHSGGYIYASCRIKKPTAAIKDNQMDCCDCGGLLTFGGRLIVYTDDELARMQNQRKINREFQELDE